ncbi:MAG: hypothetical protein JSV88_27080 [Candidatus Aminicenantes bacterium]|nr:MAG: hypothetical protein JSV88_27080 [Candidatus Aminicenantes bacterium]
MMLKLVVIIYLLGITYPLHTNVFGKDAKLVFGKSEHTVGYRARINGKSTYSALHVHLDIIPITIKIME